MAPTIKTKRGSIELFEDFVQEIIDENDIPAESISKMGVISESHGLTVTIYVLFDKDRMTGTAATNEKLDQILERMKETDEWRQELLDKL
jgi:hypothetical protein